MGRIHNLKIQNFRGLVDVECSPRRINILVGRNNSGKSSVLEALALQLCSRNGFRDSGGNDLWRSLTRQRYYNPRFLIRPNNKPFGVLTGCNRRSWWRSRKNET